jgi:hypothetical protein
MQKKQKVTSTIFVEAIDYSTGIDSLSLTATVATQHSRAQESQMLVNKNKSDPICDRYR